MTNSTSTKSWTLRRPSGTVLSFRCLDRTLFPSIFDSCQVCDTRWGSRIDGVLEVPLHLKPCDDVVGSGCLTHCLDEEDLRCPVCDRRIDVQVISGNESEEVVDQGQETEEGEVEDLVMEDDERGSMNEGYDENQNMVAGAEMETQVSASSNGACEISPPSREPTPHLAPYVSVFANAPSSHMLPVQDAIMDLDDEADAQEAMETDDMTEQMTTHDIFDVNRPPPVRNPTWIIDDDDSILSSAPSSPIWPEQTQPRVMSESTEIDHRMGRNTMSAKSKVYSFSLRHTPTKIVSFPAYIIDGSARLTSRRAASRTQTGKKSKILSFPASVVNGIARINESRRRNYTGDDMQAALSLANLRCETRLEARDLEAMFAMVGSSENEKKFEGLLRSVR